MFVGHASLGKPSRPRTSLCTLPKARKLRRPGTRIGIVQPLFRDVGLADQVDFGAGAAVKAALHRRQGRPL